MRLASHLGSHTAHSPRRAPRSWTRSFALTALAAATAATLAASGCGSPDRGTGPRPPPLSVAARSYSAARWFPARVSYALALRSVADAQLVVDELLRAGTLVD